MSKPIYIVAMPKSGSTYLSRVIGDALNSPVDGVADAVPLAREGQDRKGDYKVYQTHLAAHYCGYDYPLIPDRFQFNLDKYEPSEHIVIHLVRDPRAIAVSAKYYWEIPSVGETLDAMNEANSPIEYCYPVFMQDWIDSGVYQVKYEDLLDNPESILIALFQRFSIPYSPRRVRRAVERQEFSTRKKELEGSGDKYPYSCGIQSHNLRAGTKDEWRQHFTPELNAKAVRYFGHIMTQLDYPLEDNGVASLDKTDAKILSFSQLPKGWYYGSGDAPSEQTIAAARQINAVLLGTGDFSSTDTFPGEGGEIEVVGYSNEVDYDFIVEASGLVSLYIEDKTHILESHTDISLLDAVGHLRTTVDTGWENALLKMREIFTILPDAGLRKAQVLYELSRAATSGALVELGVAQGKGVIAMALGTQDSGRNLPVYAVDDYQEHTDWANNEYSESNLPVLIENVRRVKVGVELICNDAMLAGDNWDKDEIVLWCWDVSTNAQALWSHWLAWYPHIQANGIAFIRDLYDKRFDSDRVKEHAIANGFVVESEEPGILLLRKL